MQDLHFVEILMEIYQQHWNDHQSSRIVCIALVVAASKLVATKAVFGPIQNP